MLFNSTIFVVFFVMVIISINLAKKNSLQVILLLIASYLFYWYSSTRFILLLFFISSICYLMGNRIFIEKSIEKKKIFLILATFFSLIFLFYYKYLNFSVNTINSLLKLIIPSIQFETIPIVLPIGISFFTFQALSYVFDIYKGNLKPSPSFTKYILFVSFFPQLVAGPIVRASELLPQLNSRLQINPSDLKVGLSLMLVGYIKKTVFADNLAPYVDTVFSHPTDFGSLYIIAATIMFGFQIYFDFSGYSDIAIGAARIMGFNLPINFDKPYLARNPTAFWRKWHITLSRFIKDYVYIPLGGNRKGKVRSEANLMITMLLCGLWHGAAWNFVIWGGYHGILLVIHKLLSKNHFVTSFKEKIPYSNVVILFEILITQYFVFLGWIFFRVSNINDMWYCVTKCIWVDFLNYDYLKIPIFLIVGLCALILIEKTQFIDKIMHVFDKNYIYMFEDMPLIHWVTYLVLVTLLVLFISPTSNSEFIYFQF